MYRIIVACGLLLSLSIGNAAAQAPKATSPDLKAMYEDIEVLRRILIDDLGTGSGSPQSGANIQYTNDSIRRGLDWLYRNQSSYGPSNSDASNTAAAISA